MALQCYSAPTFRASIFSNKTASPLRLYVDNNFV